MILIVRININLHSRKITFGVDSVIFFSVYLILVAVTTDVNFVTKVKRQNDACRLRLKWYTGPN